MRRAQSLSARPDGEPQLAYIQDTLSLLWPGTDAVLESRRRVAPGTYAILPSLVRPTALTPLRPRSVTASVVSGHNTAAAGRARARLRLLGWAARLGIVDLAPNRIRIRSDHDGGVDRYVSDRLGTDVVVAVFIGPPRANRKPVLRLLSPEGETLAYAKIGVDTLTDDLVRNEAEALATLAARGLHHLRIPTLVHLGSWQGHPLLVQRALAPGTDRPGATAVMAAMGEIASLDGQQERPLAGTPYWKRLGARIDTLAPQMVATRLADLRRRVSDRLGEVAIPLGAWHGDWTPWNMCVAAGAVAVWDWERFETGVPVGYDVLHHRIQHDIVRARIDPAEAVRLLLLESRQHLDPLGLDRLQSETVAVAYLLEIGTRYVHDDLLSAGGRLGDLTTWLLPSLDEHLRTVGGSRDRD